MVIPTHRIKAAAWILSAAAVAAIGYYLYRAEYLPSELRVAVTAGDLARVEQLLGKGVDVNKPLGLPSNSVIHRAVEGGNPEVIEAVLRAGADPNALSETGMTPLMMAAFFGKRSISSVLLKYGANTDLIEDRHKNTALLIAVRKGHAEIVETLVSARADPNLGVGWGDAPLCRARSLGRPDIVKVLVHAGAKCE